MPESRRRKPKKSTAARPQPVKIKRGSAHSGPWLVPAMLACFAISIVWLLTYYFSQGDALFMGSLGGFNLLIGFGFAVGGLGLATRWR